ncbi:hypothetical protein NIES2130_14730 [Scytonema sp. HK-05]|nr:hypothetical protein NIES2130_14730 [Scytonema sp. HK-05]
MKSLPFHPRREKSGYLITLRVSPSQRLRQRPTGEGETNASHLGVGNPPAVLAPPAALVSPRA